MGLIENLDYKYVYNSSYYKFYYPSAAKAFGSSEESLLHYFIEVGMSQGQQGSPDFNVHSYRAWNKDLDFGDDLRAYYIHYIKYGRSEKRVAIGAPLAEQTTCCKEIDYKDVYKFYEYVTYNPDIWRKYGFDPERVLQHFVEHGMAEGRRAHSRFDVNAYKQFNPDVAEHFENNLEKYYLHYINHGKAENRRAYE